MTAGAGRAAKTEVGRYGAGPALKLAVHEHGEGPAVLWIHGYTMDSTLWEPLWTLLPGFRHVGVDLPGHGGSGPIEPELTLPSLATALAELAREREASRVVALSFGCVAALQLAIDHPDVVRTLAVAAPGIAGTPAEPGTDTRNRQLRLLASIGGSGEQLTDLWMSSPPDIFAGTLDHPEVRERIRETILRHGWAELPTGGMRGLLSHRQTEADLRRITARTLVVTGTRDMRAFADNAATIAGTVPGAQVIEVAAGHLPLLERPEAVAGALARHLAG
ncbi:alpha/beta fold hydrolase [Nonomuraea sp. LPB2021202275-12-8]|uniref:alpha/beta fold hydrolase n=1 Tax=Nonomuraea sp. LPB2021202275-12-8 TaxID=3120159 RepID=UPI00300D4715